MTHNNIGISILIGIYNWDVTRLIADLSRQADHLDTNYEIILLDDASDRDYQLTNAKLDFLPNVTYLQNCFNVGRSVVRNTLASKAHYPYLIFMDCDVSVCSDNYISNYIETIEIAENKERLVVAGGVVYNSTPPPHGKILRWQYGRKKEQKNAIERSKNPNYSFSTVNFLISKNVFKEVEFDENLAQYGHEDTLFGIHLLEKGIIVKHIHNPIQHDVLCSTERFLTQTQHSIDNLLLISEKVKNKSELIKNTKLLHTYEKLKNHRKIRWFMKAYQLFSSLIEKNLNSAHPSIFLYNLYKLHYLCQHA